MRCINNDRDGASKLIEQEMKYPECPWNARVVDALGMEERFKLKRGRVGEWFIFATRVAINKVTCIRSSNELREDFRNSNSGAPCLWFSWLAFSLYPMAMPYLQPALLIPYALFTLSPIVALLTMLETTESAVILMPVVRPS